MITIGLSTSSVYPLKLEDAFRLAAETGYDGVEVMVTLDDDTRDAERLRTLVERYRVPITSIHAPVLLLTHFVWGRDPRTKLDRSARLAQAVGAHRVVVHPPFRWQAGYALGFTDAVRAITAEHGIEIAVENMFPWRIAGRELAAYAPGWNPLDMDCDATVLDFSHAALSGIDALGLATRLGARLRHIHLCDGSGPLDEAHVFDEHLVPGRGHQPVAEVLRMLADEHWTGTVVAEVNTRKSKSAATRTALLAETLAFARTHTATPRLTGSSQRTLDALLRPAVAS